MQSLCFVDSLMSQLVEVMRLDNTESSIVRLQTFFEDTEYRISDKKGMYFQNVMYVISGTHNIKGKDRRCNQGGRIHLHTT